MINLVGVRFGKLVVKKYLTLNKHHHMVLECICDCGKLINTERNALKSGNTKSCGCLRLESLKKKLEELRKLGNWHGTKHGYAHTLTYKSWTYMKQRCFNKNKKYYSNYGGRGITVSNSWLKFENFFADMGERPEGMTLERINNNGDYCRENCRWATKKEQSNNTRKNRFIYFDGKKMTLTLWADLTGIHKNTIQNRLDVAKWNIRDSLTVIPTNKNKCLALRTYSDATNIFKEAESER